MSTKVRIDAIAFDAGTQIRAAINEQVVADYAERMAEGVEFPPIVLFHDGNTHYLADGFHRYMASKRVGFTDIAADVQPGTKDDALWFALGANKENGQRLTEADKTHAVSLALAMWPTKMQREIANQVGCSPALVSKVFAKDTAKNTGVVPGIRGRALVNQMKRDGIREMVLAGEQSIDIRDKLNVHPETIAAVRKELGLSNIDYSRKGVDQRRDQMRTMAADGYTSRQIAAALSISEDALRVNLKKLGIDVPADKAIRGTHRHDSNRILDRIAIDAENLSEGVNLIEFADLDGDRFGDWIDSLMASKLTIDTLIKRLLKERKRHGEAA